MINSVVVGGKINDKNKKRRESETFHRYRNGKK